MYICNKLVFHCTLSLYTTHTNLNLNLLSDRLTMTKGDCDQNPSHSSSTVSIELETTDSPRSDHSDYSESSSIDIIDDGINRPGYCRRPWRHQSSNVEEKGLGYDNGDDKCICWGCYGICSFCFYFSAVFAAVVIPLLVIWAISRQKPDLFLEV